MLRKTNKLITLLASILLTLSITSIAAPRRAMASLPIQKFDSNAFYDGISYITRNPNAPTPSLPWTNGGWGDIIESDGWTLTDKRFESNALARANGAVGLKLTVRFPEQGIYYDAITKEATLIDIYDTFEVLQSIGEEGAHVQRYAGGKMTGQMLLDGWWVDNSPLYKDTYVFKKAHTDEIIHVNTLAYTERSMNAGEGFALVGATQAFITDDMPNIPPAPTANGDYFVANHLPGTNVLTADINNQNAHGFIGAFGTSIGNSHAFENQIGPNVIYADGPIVEDYLKGTDASGVVRSTIDGVPYDDTSMWLGASATTSTDVAAVNIYGIKLDFPGAGTLSNGWNGISSDFFADATRMGGNYANITDWQNRYVGRWYVPSFAPFTAPTPPAPTKIVDKVQAYGTEALRYTIRQKVCHNGVDSAFGYTYSHMQLTDTIDADLTYNQDLVVLDTNGNDITRRGTTSISNHTLTWTASKELLNSLDYNGGHITFTFTASTTSPANDWKYDNSGRVNINSQGKNTNTVKTDLRYGPLPHVAKHDFNTKTTRSQADANTTGATFTVRYWFAARSATECLAKAPTRTWTFKSSSGPTLVMDAAHKISGDALYTKDGAVVTPLHGFISVTETKAPTGYRLNGTTKWYNLG
jgi:fimbrial isopeptide formation D2 family protein